MMSALRITIFALIAAAAGLLASSEAFALLSKHNCTFCHSLHGAPSGGGSTSLVTRGITDVEVLCLGCHISAVDGGTYGTDIAGTPADPVQSHRSDGGMAEFYVGCIDCHEVHDNMPNWLDGLPGGNHDSGQPGVPGTNAKMVGTKDPEGTTPYAVIRTKEKDFDRNGLPDRGTVTQTCDALLVNDCYTTERRYIVFEHAAPVSQVHAWAENTGNATYPLQDPATEVGGPGPSDPTVIRTNESDSGALVGGTENWSAYDSICGMCHTQTANHNLLTGSGLAHNDTRACTDCHQHDLCFDRASCSTVVQTATRDLQAVLTSALPAAVTVGDTVTISVDVTNLGNRVEAFDVRYFSDIEGYLGMSWVDLAASGGTASPTFGWVTTVAGLHTVKVDIEPVIHETVIDNNYDMVTVSVSPPSAHDVAVTSLSAPGVVLLGDTATVSANVANLGTFEETFNVVLYDNTDDPGHAAPIGTLSSGLLLSTGTAILNFSWNTTGASLGSHTLEAVATHDGADGGTDTNTANDSATTTSTVSVPTHDVAVDSVTAPASTPQGNTVAVDVVVSNPGTFTETFNVTLASNLDGTIQTLSSGALLAGGSTTLNFSWDTTGATINTHTLTATAAHDGGDGGTDSNAGNNSASTSADVIPAGPINDVAVLSVTASPNPVGPTTGGGDDVTFTVIVQNQGTVSETIDVTVASDLEGATVCSITGVNLGAGLTSTTEFVCIWKVKSNSNGGTHLITATAATVPGETDTADNTGTTTLVVN